MLIVGLGNPGTKYAGTRHNFGFHVLNAFAEHRGISFKAGKGSYVYGRSPEGFILMKSTSYMNNSGMPVAQAVRFFDVDLKDVMIVFDDIDLPLGSIRFREKGSAGGHRGVASVIQSLGTTDFPRLRLGIASDANMKPSEKYVLKSFRAQDVDVVNEVTITSIKALDFCLSHNMRETMNQYNSKKQSLGDEE